MNRGEPSRATNVATTLAAARALTLALAAALVSIAAVAGTIGAAGTAATTGAAARTPDFASAVARFGDRLAADVAADGVGSIAAAVVVGESVVWSGAYGLADVERGVPATPSTIYRTGSISKTVTAVVLLRLVERGVVRLDQPVADHLPEILGLANAGPGHRPITYRDLASHTAGLAREPAATDAARGAIAGWEAKALAAIPATTVDAAPGVRYAYSNIGYGLLGLALSRAAGRPFIELVDEHVFAPLGMRDSRFVVPRRDRGRLAAGYVNQADGTIDPRVPRAEHRGRGYKVPNGGVYSTVDDLARLVAGLSGAAGDALLGEAARAEMLRMQTPGDDRAGYGLGLQLRRVAGLTIVGHGGTVAGYTAYMTFDPATGIGVILLRNYNSGATNLAAAAHGLLLDLTGGQ